MPANQASSSNDVRAGGFGHPGAPEPRSVARLHAIGDRYDMDLAEETAHCACGCHEAEPLRSALRTALRSRIHAFGEVELRQRELHEWVVLLVAFTVTIMLAAPAMVPLVLALQGQRP